MKCVHFGLMVGVLAACLACEDKEPPAVSESVSTKNVAVSVAQERPAKPPTRKASDVAQERGGLDRTVWQQEVEAQRYEQVFVGLWDTLRSDPDPWSVLEKFKLGTISWAEPTSPSKLAGDILERRLSGASRTLGWAAWKARLGQWRDAGYRLIQSEWHHARFVSATKAQKAQSTINVTLHLSHGPNKMRWSIEGPISVTWASGGSKEPRVESIDVGQLSILESRGGLNFQEFVAAEDPRQPLLPLITEDIDADGDVDVLLPGHNLLLRNTKGRLSREPLFAQPPPKTESEVNVGAALLADLDGDGLLDLLTTANDMPPRLFIGATGGRFPTAGRIISLETGAQHHPSAITAGDVDGDGDLDIWLTQYKDPFIGGQMPTPYYDANDGYPSSLLINDGRGQFHDGTAAAGLEKRRYRRTYSASFVDLDDDQDLDLVVVSDFSGVDVYANDGKGRFADMNAAWLPARNSFGMSHTFGDFDLDGDADLYVTGMSSTTARRLTAMGLGRDERADIHEMRPAMGYGNRAYLLGKTPLELAPFTEQLARSGWTWGSVSFDLENDGDPDIYLANGHISGKTASDYCTEFWRHDIYTGSSKDDSAIGDFYDQSIRRQRTEGLSWNGFEHNHLFLNMKGRQFRNVAWLAGAAQEDDARSVASVDLDNDGLEDLLVAVSPSPRSSRYRLLYLHNRPEKSGHWIGFRLRGAPGLSPIGATVELKAGGRTRRAAVINGDSFLTQHPTEVHFGLGEIRKVTQVNIRWPDGRIQTLEKPPINAWHTVAAPGRP